MSEDDIQRTLFHLADYLALLTLEGHNLFPQSQSVSIPLSAFHSSNPSMGSNHGDKWGLARIIQYDYYNSFTLLFHGVQYIHTEYFILF